MILYMGFGNAVKLGDGCRFFIKTSDSYPAFEEPTMEVWVSLPTVAYNSRDILVAAGLTQRQSVLLVEMILSDWSIDKAICHVLRVVAKMKKMQADMETTDRND